MGCTGHKGGGASDNDEVVVTSLFLWQGGVTKFAVWYSAASKRSIKPKQSSDPLVDIVTKINSEILSRVIQFV